MITPKEYMELLECINTNYSYTNFSKNLQDDQKIVQYVQSSCDIKNNEIWNVKIMASYIMGSKVHYCTKQFLENECTIENIKNWLKKYEEGNLNDS